MVRVEEAKGFCQPRKYEGSDAETKSRADCLTHYQNSVVYQYTDRHRKALEREWEDRKRFSTLEIVSKF